MKPTFVAAPSNSRADPLSASPGDHRRPGTRHTQASLPRMRPPVGGVLEERWLTPLLTDA